MAMSIIFFLLIALSHAAPYSNAIPAKRFYATPSPCYIAVPVDTATYTVEESTPRPDSRFNRPVNTPPAVPAEEYSAQYRYEPLHADPPCTGDAPADYASYPPYADMPHAYSQPEPVQSYPTVPVNAPASTIITPMVAAPVTAPTAAPTAAPVTAPTAAPTAAPVTAPVTSTTAAPTAAPVTAPTAAPRRVPPTVPAAVVRSPSPVPVPGTIAKAEGGSIVAAKGDTTVSAAADKKSGAVSANGKDAAIGAARPGAAIGLGITTRNYRARATPCPKNTAAPPIAYKSGVSDYNAGASNSQPRAANYQTGASDYQTGASDYQTGATDYQTGATGATDYQTGASDYQGGASDYENGGSGYQGSSSDTSYAQNRSSGDVPNTTAGSSDNYVQSMGDKKVSPTTYDVTDSSNAYSYGHGGSGRGVGGKKSARKYHRGGSRHSRGGSRYSRGGSGHSRGSRNSRGAPKTKGMTSGKKSCANGGNARNQATSTGYDAGSRSHTSSTGGQIPTDMSAPVAGSGSTPATGPAYLPRTVPVTAPAPAVMPTAAPTAAPVSAPAATPAPSRVPGTAAVAENGSAAVAIGDTTVSAAADKKSGVVAANGKNGAIGVAGVGAAIGLGLSSRAYRTPCPQRSNAAAVEYDGGNSYGVAPYSKYEDGDVSNDEMAANGGYSTYGATGAVKTPCPTAGNKGAGGRYPRGVPVAGGDASPVSQTVPTGPRAAQTQVGSELATTTPDGEVAPQIRHPQADKVNGSAAVSENGSRVMTKGKTTVSAAADKKSGAIAVTGEDGAVAAAGIGAAIGLGLSV